MFQDSLKFVRKNTKEFVPTVNSNLTCSLMRILECFFAPFVPKEVCRRTTFLLRCFNDFFHTINPFGLEVLFFRKDHMMLSVFFFFRVKLSLPRTLLW